MAYSADTRPNLPFAPLRAALALVLVAMLGVALFASSPASAAASQHEKAGRPGEGSLRRSEARDSSRPRLHWRGRGATVSGIVGGRACRVRARDDRRVRTVQFKLVGHGGKRIATRRVKLDDRRSGIARASFLCQLDTRDLPNGRIRVRATAVDEAGNRRSVVRTFVVRNPVKAPLRNTRQVSPRWFSPSSFWNRPLGDAAPLSSQSGAYVQDLVRQVDDAGPWVNYDRYSVPIYTVSASQATVPVRIVRDDGERPDPALASAFSAVPIPSDAVPADGTDRHLVVWQPDTDRMWEFWDMRKEDSGWVAQHGGAMDEVSTSPGYFDDDAWAGAQDWWGATATSLPLVGGLITVEELQAGSIEHTLALAIPEPSPDHVWPAQRSDGYNDSSSAIPEGTIFRLPASLDVSSLGLPPVVETIATAAQRYGMVVRDVSGCVCLYAEDPAPTGSEPYRDLFEGEYPNSLLEQFPWAELKAIQPGV
jgi:hypothetical protein